MKMKASIYSLLLLAAFASAKSVKVQTVNYHDGTVPEEEDPSIQVSSEMEDIPPRAEWFRVRGGGGGRTPHSQAIAHEDSEIVELPTGRTHERVVVVANAVRGSNTQQSMARSGGDSYSNNMHVQVKNRGRAGLQTSRSMKQQHQSEDHDGNGEEAEVFTKRFGEHDDEEHGEEMGTQPGRQRNRHPNARHQTSHNNRESANYQAISKSSGSRHQQPREPDEDEEVLVEDRSSRKQEEDVEASHHNNRRVDHDDDVEYEDVNDSISTSRNRNVKPNELQARPVHIPDGQRRYIKTSRDSSYLSGNSPPPHDQVAKMARYIVHNSNWTSVATISTMSAVKGYPFANVFSVSDGPINDSTGTPYMYLTPLDMSATDLKQDSRASLTMSLAQSDYCRQQRYDPEDPRCAHVILSGRIVEVKHHDEKRFAMNSLFSRHPDMTDWPKDHGWYFAKLDIEHIVVLDYFGGGKTVSLDDYFNQDDL